VSATTDALAGFTKEPSRAGQNPDLYRIGEGPAVIVISEIPGITPLVASFARKVAERGLTAVLPHLFGEPGADPRGRPSPRPWADLHLAPVLPARPRPHEPHHGVAARTGCRRARPVRRPRRRRDRYVPHRGFALAMEWLTMSSWHPC